MKWRVGNSLSGSIPPLSLHFLSLSISSFSPHFLAARLLQIVKAWPHHDIVTWVNHCIICFTHHHLLFSAHSLNLVSPPPSLFAQAAS